MTRILVTASQAVNHHAQRITPNAHPPLVARAGLLGIRCPKCDGTYAAPEARCMVDGTECHWIELPQEDRAPWRRFAPKSALDVPRERGQT
jgi:hypothetical protein